jgi:aerobic-type carbon monoxide dehydrogenase small subunit (CoxS/CutS family)
MPAVDPPLNAFPYRDFRRTYEFAHPQGTSVKLTINNASRTVPDDQLEEPLLWVLRDTLGLVGTRYGCDSGICGNCNVLIDGAATRSCQRTPSQVEAGKITTLEGLANGDALEQLHPVQQAFLENPLQCCWCMTGHIIEAVALLERNPNPTSDQIDETMNRNYCRCGGYNNIRKNVVRAAELMAKKATS